MNETTHVIGAAKPRRLLTQNGQLRKEGIFNWTLPAWKGQFADGRQYNACPQAGSCQDLCYARVGTYRFRNVLEAHERNLRMVIDHPEEWEQQMGAELAHKRFQGNWIRLHDSGDFFSREYLLAWLRLMRGAPDVKFYCYTKAIRLFRRFVEPDPPENFLWCYSLGGMQDHLLDLATDRHAEVFPGVAELEAAGYHDQTESDLLSVLGPEKVGIPANRIPHLLKRQGSETFGSLQRALDARLAEERKNYRTRREQVELAS